jgi:hypothetical protein
MTSKPDDEIGAHAADDLQLSLVRGDAVFRLQRSVGLIPRNGFGLVRRALLIALITWLPIAVWAFVRRRLFQGTVTEPLLSASGSTSAVLVALSLLVFGEGVAHGVTMRLIPCFVRSGLFRETDRETPRQHREELLDGSSPFLGSCTSARRRSTLSRVPRWISRHGASPQSEGMSRCGVL